MYQMVLFSKYRTISIGFLVEYYFDFIYLKKICMFKISNYIIKHN